MAKLYVVATPIGNLQDFSPRGIETLRQADLIVAEDTRVTMKLCQVFDIHTRMTSCHRHNEESKGLRIAEQIAEENLTAALTTDAGTPCISDPGNELVKACLDRGVEVVPVPGCCAGIAAVSVSGADAREFAFYGFLPREKKDLREKLRQICGGPRVAVIHESPFRVADLLEAMEEIMPQARLTVCCDLTKLHEKNRYGTPAEVLSDMKADEKAEKGEYCVVADLHIVPLQEPEKTASEAELSLEARLTDRMRNGMSLREAQEALVAEGKKKNAVKQAALNLKKMFE
ncbi:MAG: 16S rRNA (cytidine(1402)-2'-O)-methyltransferase [Clostridia bacterium]|nr:16S rRNA (cytidine(1402)-2'-O)-methyltransferase [Clostridia bacterium]